MGFLDQNIGDMDLSELTSLIRRIATSALPANIATLGDLDQVITVPDVAEQDQALTYDEGLGRFVLSDITSAFVSTDGGTPTQLTVELEPGPGWLQATWNIPSGTEDFLLYKVFIRAGAAPTTGDDTYLVDTTPATSYVLSVDAAGGELIAANTYHVKVIAVSATSGNQSAESADVSAVVGEIDGSVLVISNIDAGNITTGFLGAARIDAGTITASHLSVTELSAITADMGTLTAGTIHGGVVIAGDEDSYHVRVGEAEHNGEMMLGIHSFDIDGMTVNFMLDAMTGDVFLNGRVTFGVSHLTSDGYVELGEQAVSGLMEPDVVQSRAAAGTGTAISTSWAGETVAGNLLVGILQMWDSDGTVPTAPTAPGGWLAIGSHADSLNDSRICLYFNDGAPAESGAVTMTAGDSVRWIFTILELSGVETSGAFDEFDGDDGSGTRMTINSVTTDPDTVVIGALGFGSDAVADYADETVNTELLTIRQDAITTGGTNQNLWTGILNVSAASTYTYELDTYDAPGGTLESVIWVGVASSFKKKTAGMGSIEPGEDRVRMFAADLGSGEAQAFSITENGNISQIGGPTGAITAFAGSADPDGWLICDGRAISRTTYAALFDLVGESFGPGDSSTTFNIPNLEGRVVVGVDSGQTEFDVVGETGGAKTHTLTSAEMPAHTHGAGSYQAHANDAANTTATGGSNRLTSLANAGGQTGDITGTSGSTGGGGAHQNLQPYISLHYIIKV